MRTTDRLIAYANVPATGRRFDPMFGEMLTPRQRRRVHKKVMGSLNRMAREIDALEGAHVQVEAMDEVQAPEAMTRDELRKVAAELEIKGRGKMSKAQLATAIEEARRKR